MTVRLITMFLLLASAAFATDVPRILVLGDSFMTSNASSRASVVHELKRLTGGVVKSRAVPGARFFNALPISGALGLNITRQYRAGRWDYVVLNGGGIDLWLGCGCRPCKGLMDRLISIKGNSGAIPALITKARGTGAKVIYVGYLRSPGRGSPIENCRPLGDTLEQRVEQMAARDPNIIYVSLKDMVPYGDSSFHAFDMIHPSPKGSRTAAKRIANAIQKTQ